MRRSLILVSLVASICGCGPNQRILNSAENRPATPVAEQSNSAPTTRTFEQDLDSMRTADFNFIYVLRRKDGAVLDTDDKAFLSGVTPTEMNRRTLSDQGKAVIIGSNFRLPVDIIEILKGRFLFEDYSKPVGEIGNSNVNR